jgi:hypothetical protein
MVTKEKRIIMRNYANNDFSRFSTNISQNKLSRKISREIQKNIERNPENI